MDIKKYFLSFLLTTCLNCGKNYISASKEEVNYLEICISEIRLEHYLLIYLRVKESAGIVFVVSISFCRMS